MVRREIKDGAMCCSGGNIAFGDAGFNSYTLKFLNTILVTDYPDQKLPVVRRK